MSATQSFFRVLLLLVFVNAAGAQDNLPAPSRPVRNLGPVEARATVAITSVYPGVRGLSGGRVLVNDQVGKRIMLLDSALRVLATPFDSAGGTTTAYGTRSLGLIPGLGDTTYVAEPTSVSFVVLDRDGKTVRVEAAPRPGDMGVLSASNFGFPRFDSRGNLIYRVAARPAPAQRNADGTMSLVQPADSAIILRVGPGARVVDTIARIRISSLRNVLDTLEAGKTRQRMIFEVLPNIDEWAVFADGTVAIVRGTDYHIDWYSPDGVRTSTPKIPMDWLRLTDADKQQKVDSARATYESTRTEETRARAIASNAPQIDFVSPKELPDYVPPVRLAGVKAAPDGNVWILPSTSTFAAGIRGLVYDVVNRRGELVERVRFPEGRVLAGFSEHGGVYMLAHEGGKYFLERAR
jgi:hypothetical protein